MIWVKFAKKFLAAFASKDLETLAEMYSDNIQSSDWGKKNVTNSTDLLEVNEVVFNAAKQIEISISNTAYHNKYICIEYVMSIELYNVEKHDINIISVFEINDVGKIQSIRSYKQ